MLERERVSVCVCYDNVLLPLQINQLLAAKEILYGRRVCESCYVCAQSKKEINSLDWANSFRLEYALQRDNLYIWRKKSCLQKHTHEEAGNLSRTVCCAVSKWSDKEYDQAKSDSLNPKKHQPASVR